MFSAPEPKTAISDTLKKCSETVSDRINILLPHFV